jgi:hypothetical protein
MSADLSSLTPLANHLSQSMTFVGVIWLITLGLKRYRAAVRYERPGRTEGRLVCG